MKIRKNDELLGLANVDVIGAAGEKLGVMNPEDALRLAREQGVDLVEVNPWMNPPVCKLLDLAKYTYEAKKKAALHRRGTGLVVFLVRSKFRIRARPGVFVAGDIVTGDAIRVGMIARIPDPQGVVHAIPIHAVEFLDHVGEKTSELALQIIGETPEQVSISIEIIFAHPAVMTCFIDPEARRVADEIQRMFGGREPR